LYPCGRFLAPVVIVAGLVLAPAPALAAANDSWAPQAPAAPVALVVESSNGPLPYPPVHATLLPDGRIMLFGVAGRYEKAAWFQPTPFDQEPPAQVTLTVDNVPVDIDPPMSFTDASGLQWYIEETLFCSGHSLMDDGSIFVAGGTFLYQVVNPATQASVVVAYGMPNATLYSYPTRTWSRLPGNMLGVGESNQAVRWYGAVTRLADKRMLVTSGLDLAATETFQAGQIMDRHIGTQNRSVETWTAANGFTLVSANDETPAEVWNHDYTHVFLFPDPTATNLVLMFGDAGVPVFLAPDAPAGSKWARLTFLPRPGAGTSVPPNHGASSTLLPLRAINGEWGYANGSVVQAGGGRGAPTETRIDAFDFTRGWFPGLDTGVHRRYPAMVLLPDGKVLIVSGYDATGASALVRNAQYLDPRPPASFSTGSAAMGEVRGYHNVALLLPDGRVFVAGGRTGGEVGTEAEKPNFRYLYPPYMSPRESPPPRPAITSAPATINYGTNFPVKFSGGPVTEVVLMGLGSMTHSFDMNQRYVQLSFTSSGAAVVQVQGPPDIQTAPPGYYMLFVLNQNFVPSVARIVQVVQ
jgi:hypothetical protein